MTLLLWIIIMTLKLCWPLSWRRCKTIFALTLYFIVTGLGLDLGLGIDNHWSWPCTCCPWTHLCIKSCSVFTDCSGNRCFANACCVGCLLSAADVCAGGNSCHWQQWRGWSGEQISISILSDVAWGQRTTRTVRNIDGRPFITNEVGTVMCRLTLFV